jgi:SAM-dependent methyltransferase
VNEREDLQIFARGFFDFICSSITLQHIDPVYAKRYLKEFLRVLAPGGALVFNLPLRPSRLGDRFCYRFFRRRWYNREKKKVWPALIMEMHGISRRKVIKLITRAGGRILQIVNDPASGEKWISLKYFVQKPEYLLKIIPSKIPGSFRSGDMTTIALRIENRGSEALQPESADPNLKVGGKLFPDKPGIKEGAVKEYRAPLPLPLAPGESRDVEMGVEFFDVQKGKYVLLLDMVVEDKYWFNERSCAPLIKKVNIF